MTTSTELLRQGRTDELWQRYVGFLDLSLEDFMEIQRRKVLEHVAWLSQCELGRKIIGKKVPKTVQEFRERVPLTTYSDYAPYLLERSSTALPEEPLTWVRTSGRGGEYAAKWSPIFREGWEDAIRPMCVACLVLATCRYKGDFRLRPGDRMPFTWAPHPWSMSVIARAIGEELPIVIMPSEEVAASMSFQDRIDTALQMALRDGMDLFFGLSSVLLKVGAQFAEQSSKRQQPSADTLDPRAVSRLLSGKARSKLAGRAMYPKDLWEVKGIMAGGTDTDIFADRIEEYWGVRPSNAYGSAEFTGIATQVWDRTTLTPFPDVEFFEFIPLKEAERSRSEPGFLPQTLLLDQVEAGKTYELVLTSLRGSTFTRYRIGDLVRIESLRNEACGINLPQMTVQGRCDDVIDLAGFTRLTERTIWYAVAKSGVPHEEWMCRKELEKGQAVLHLWVEPKDGHLNAEDVRGAIHESLQRMDSDYRDLEQMLDYNPLRVDLLSPGTFYRYMLDRQAAGAEPAHFKPRHFVRSQEVLDLVLAMDARGRSGGA